MNGEPVEFKLTPKATCLGERVKKAYGIVTPLMKRSLLYLLRTTGELVVGK